MKKLCGKSKSGQNIVFISLSKSFEDLVCYKEISLVIDCFVNLLDLEHLFKLNLYKVTILD